MNNFMHPAFLWGIGGLVLPVIIHLLSKKDGKIRKVGSLRYMQPSDLPSFRSIKLNEIFLLAVRCVLLVVLVLFISEMIFPPGGTSSKSKWMVLDRELQSDLSLRVILDSLNNEGYELHALENGIPGHEQETNSIVDYWSLVTILGRQTDTEIIVFSRNQYPGFQGKRLVLPPNIKWVPVTTDDKEFLARAVRKDAENVLVRKAFSSAGATRFEFVKAGVGNEEQFFVLGEDSVMIDTPDTIHVKLVVTPDYAHDSKILMASLKAISNSVADVIEIHTDSAFKNIDWLIWLSDSIPPKIQNCIYMDISTHAPLMVQHENGAWQITKRLNQEVASDGKLTTMLFDLLIPTGNDSILRKMDRRVNPEAMLWSGVSKESNVKLSKLSSRQPLIFCLVILLFIAERVLAFYKKL